MKKGLLSIVLLVCMVLMSLQVPVFAEESEGWQLETSMPTARTSLGVVAVGDKIYAIGGESPYNSPTDVVEKFDSKTGTWSTAAPLPQKISYLGVAVVGDKIYSIGGWLGRDELNLVYIYDTISNKWSSGKSMPTARRGAATAVIGDKIYVIGGYATKTTDKLEIYDTKKNTWSTGNPMPTIRNLHSAVVVGDKIYVSGGYSSTPETVVEIYDTRTNSWSKGTPLPEKKYAMGYVTVNNKIYLIGGAFARNDVDIYDIEADSWNKGTPMSVNRGWLSATFLNGKIYAIGGMANSANNSPVFNTMESISLDDIIPKPPTPEPPTPNTLSVLLEVGETVRLSVSNSLSTNANFTWTSEDEAVAIVDTNGKVTALSEGLVKITVENPDGSYVESISICVKAMQNVPTWTSINDNVTGTDNNQIEYSSNWTHHLEIGAYNNDETYSNEPNSYFQVKFNGTGIKWRGALNDTCGIVAVYLDGKFIKNVDCYLATRSDDELLFDSGELVLGQHILKVVILPDKHPDSIERYITVDRVEIKD